MQIIKDIQQQTPEWFNLRKGRMTASHAQAIASNGKGLNTYITELIAEYYAVNSEHFTNPDTERGNRLEDSAILAYEGETNNTVEKVTFVLLDDFVGCSPDGLIENDGLIEVKCPNNKNFFLISLSKDNIPTDYIWQMQMQMYVTNRKWADFVAYNPNFKEHLVIYRIIRDEEAINKIKIGIEEGKKLIKELKKNYESKVKKED